MKISEMGNYVVLFVNPTNAKVEHTVVYEELPNVATLQENFNELDELDISCDKRILAVSIITIEKFISVFGDEELSEDTDGQSN